MKKFIAGTILAALLAVACFPLNADADESSEPNQEASLHHMKEGSAAGPKIAPIWPSRLTERTVKHLQVLTLNQRLCQKLETSNTP